MIALSIFWVKSQHLVKQGRSFKESLAFELSKHQLTLIQLPNINYDYAMGFQSTYFIAQKSGINDLYKADIRSTNEQELIAIKNIKQITHTPLSDEKILYSEPQFLVYENAFDQVKILNILTAQKNIHLTLKHKDQYEVKQGKIYINQTPYTLSQLENNTIFSTYIESLNQNKKTDIQDLQQELIKQAIPTPPPFKYIQNYKTSKSKNADIKFYQIQIPKQALFSVYFINMEAYQLSLVDSGGASFNKTGLFFKKKTRNITFDFIPKGGLQTGKNLIRPILNNFPTLQLSAKGYLHYGLPQKKDLLFDSQLLLQIDTPLMEKGNKKLQIKNIKLNLTKEAKQIKMRTGICFKGNQMGLFSVRSSRSLLIDYLYLIDCDYALHSGTQHIKRGMVPNDLPKLSLTPIGVSTSSLPFKKIKGIPTHSTDTMTIYALPCHSLNLEYLSGSSDPLFKKRQSHVLSENSLSLPLGSIDPINPDAIFSNNTSYFQSFSTTQKDYFVLDQMHCRIEQKPLKNKPIFLKQGKRLTPSTHIPKTSKYHKVLSAIAIKSGLVYLYQFHIPTVYSELFSQLKTLEPEAMILFENYQGQHDKKAGKLLFNKIKNQKMIRPF